MSVATRKEKNQYKMICIIQWKNVRVSGWTDLWQNITAEINNHTFSIHYGITLKSTWQEATVTSALTIENKRNTKTARCIDHAQLFSPDTQQVYLISLVNMSVATWYLWYNYTTVKNSCHICSLGCVGIYWLQIPMWQKSNCNRHKCTKIIRYVINMYLISVQL